MDLGIAGKWALVCGASKGLGLGCAQALVREGVHVLIVARGAQALQQAATQLIAEHAHHSGASVQYVAADITTAAGRAAVFAMRQDFDIVVTNAGGPPPGDFRNWERDAWIGRSWQERIHFAVFPHLFIVDDRDADRFMGTRLFARGCFANRQALMTHVAFSNNTFRLAVNRNFVRTHQSTILASDAPVIQVTDDAGRSVLLVRLHRAARQTCRFQTVMAGSRHMLHDR